MAHLQKGLKTLIAMVKIVSAEKANMCKSMQSEVINLGGSILINGRSFKKEHIYIRAIFLFVLICIISGLLIYQQTLKKQSGILLSFDDYNPQNWEQYFDLFDDYNVKVTFFINASSPTDFCDMARSRGHEIAFHTVGHVKLTEVSEEEFFAQAIAPIEVFKEYGYEITSFAYPYGEYTDWMNEELLKYYNVVRGAYYYQLYDKDDFNKEFVESKPIDNIYYKSDEIFQADITRMLTEASINEGTIVSLYSHAIDGGDWCVMSDRIEYIFQKAQELNLKFYTYMDLQ